MFGQQNNQNQPDEAQIPETSIDNVMNDQLAPAVAAPASWQHPGMPLDGSVVPAQVVANDQAVVEPESETSGATAPTLGMPVNLVDIKQQALSQLAPLVGHLDQSPEERFRTTMMMIQASDDQALIKDAYAAAQAITDEKARAQALLDIVNEINYFTQQPAE
jgi:hypothetical protein